MNTVNFDCLHLVTKIAEPDELLIGIYREAVIEEYRRGEKYTGWRFYVEKVVEKGANEPLWDTWEEHFSDIMRYPILYTSRQCEWTDVSTGKTVDIKKILGAIE